MFTGNLWSLLNRLILVSVLMAIKYNEDFYFDNPFYARVGGIPTKEMNILEVNFHHLIQFDLFVDHEAYIQYFKKVSEITSPEYVRFQENLLELPLLSPSTVLVTLDSFSDYQDQNSCLNFPFPLIFYLSLIHI
eukprot:TRINITY_DN4304_c0_g1_i1.p3 TRINITY_DN4304_c0_g1~~TRINITY_DN4304_c0_g1_i1.p3  ORF type:complete len:134 (+),score=8.90 TRINITY_DN4304_c0_g1_i1:376-777(+)